MMATILRFLPKTLTESKSIVTFKAVVTVEVDIDTSEVQMHLMLDDTHEKGPIAKPMRIIMSEEERQMLREAGSVGGKLSSSRMSKRARAKRARAAALARWKGKKGTK